MIAPGATASFRFSSHWLIGIGLRQLPVLLVILGLQFAYRIDPESATSPVALYVLMNLVAVAGLSAYISFAHAHGPEIRLGLSIAALGFLLLITNEIVTWGTETLVEDLCVLGVWVVTASSILYVIPRLARAGIVRAILTLAVMLQFFALAADLIDDGAIGANAPDDWLSWIYALTSVGSVAACQTAFLYLAMRPSQASHGWQVTARGGADNMKHYFDVGVADADEAIVAVERQARCGLRKLRAVAPIPATSFHALGLAAGEVRPR